MEWIICKDMAGEGAGHYTRGRVCSPRTEGGGSAEDFVARLGKKPVKIGNASVKEGRVTLPRSLPSQRRLGWGRALPFTAFPGA
jgi:hypothetical protein